MYWDPTFSYAAKVDQHTQDLVGSNSYFLSLVCSRIVAVVAGSFALLADCFFHAIVAIVKIPFAFGKISIYLLTFTFCNVGSDFLEIKALFMHALKIIECAARFFINIPCSLIHPNWYNYKFRITTKIENNIKAAPKTPKKEPLPQPPPQSPIVLSSPVSSGITSNDSPLTRFLRRPIRNLSFTPSPPRPNPLIPTPSPDSPVAFEQKESKEKSGLNSTRSSGFCIPPGPFLDRIQYLKIQIQLCESEYNMDEASEIIDQFQKEYESFPEAIIKSLYFTVPSKLRELRGIIDQDKLAKLPHYFSPYVPDAAPNNKFLMESLARRGFEDPLRELAEKHAKEKKRRVLQIIEDKKQLAARRNIDPRFARSAEYVVAMFHNTAAITPLFQISEEESEKTSQEESEEAFVGKEGEPQQIEGSNEQQIEGEVRAPGGPSKSDEEGG